MTKSLVIIAGPTASGKTSLAIELALHFKTEIISADSRLFYKELTIGTAKPEPHELEIVPHHFINSHFVTQHITVGDFALACNGLLHSLFKTYDVVIMAGGSGLYIDAVINGMDDLPPSHPEIRSKLNTRFQAEGIIPLQHQLLELDEKSYNTIDIQNPRRLIRALEVTLSTGIPYSKLLGKRNSGNEWNVIMIGIDWPRDQLYKRINERTAIMIQNGLKEEAFSVIKYRNMNSLSTVGYKEMFDHLDGKISLEETEKLIAQHTRNYAKRQMTWFRKYDEMIWMPPGPAINFIEIINKKNQDNS